MLSPIPLIITPTILYNLIFLTGSREDNLHITGIIHHHHVNPITITIAMITVINININVVIIIKIVVVTAAYLLLFLQSELIFS